MLSSLMKLNLKIIMTSEKEKNCFSTIKSDMTSSAVEYQMFQSSKNMKEFSQITKIKILNEVLRH
jgi:hypothetical protein